MESCSSTRIRVRTCSFIQTIRCKCQPDRLPLSCNHLCHVPVSTIGKHASRERSCTYEPGMDDPQRRCSVLPALSAHTDRPALKVRSETHLGCATDTLENCIQLTSYRLGSLVHCRPPGDKQWPQHNCPSTLNGRRSHPLSSRPQLTCSGSAGKGRTI